MKKTLLLAIVAAMLLFGPIMNAQAVVCPPCTGDPTIWVPTESGDIDIQYFGRYVRGYEFAIFDDMSALDDSDPHFMLRKPTPDLVADTVVFEKEGNDWKITSNDSGLSSVVLKDSKRFQVAARGNDGIWVGGIDNGALSIGMHDICWPDCINLTQIDAQPVPIPGAVWLLGSGLVGLVGFARKKRA